MPVPQLGVCYYPEHWPRERWEADAAGMVAAGISHVRIGEFAWAQLEPRPGELHFEWLAAAMDALGGHGLKVILCTPTATPPRWMLDRHPDMLPVDAEGRVRGFGSRRHYCFSHPGYREECRRIVHVLAERMGQHPALCGWQTDNEYGCHNTTYSYSEAARRGFQSWLQQKYETVAALNAAWGNDFWSMAYERFEQIDLPRLTVAEANPAALLDFRRYSSAQVASFNRLQYEILKAARPDLPVIHNFMGRFTDFDHYEVAQGIDVASWDAYPLGHLAVSREPEAVKRLYLRQGEPDAQALQHDIYRAVGRGRWWVMEQQPGPVNWAAYNPDPLPGMVRLWTWEAFAHGAELVSYFRWRQYHSAQEQMHAGLLRSDGQPAPAFAEVQQVAEELKTTGIAGAAVPARVGIVYDYESEWAWEIQPQAQGFSHHAQVREVYASFRKRGLDVDILPPASADFSGYAIVAIPALFTWKPDLLAAIGRFEGQVLIGPRSGSKTENFSIPPELPPALPPEWLDARVIRVDTSDPGYGLPVKGGGAVLHWRERLETTAEVVMEDEEDWPVLVAQGRISYLAASGDWALMQRVVDHLIEEARLPTLNLPAGVRCRVRDGCRIYVNYSDGEATLVPAADEAGYVLGDTVMPAAGVTIARLATAG